MLGMDPRIIETWPGALLEEYRQLEILEPFGPMRDNWHAAQIAHILASVYTAKGRKPPQFSDFFYKDPYTREQEQVEAADTFFFKGKLNG